MSSLCIACSDPLGMESRKITDGQITASTEFHGDLAYGAKNGRLNFTYRVDEAGVRQSGGKQTR